MIARVTSLRSRTVSIICFWFLFAAQGQGTSMSSLARSFDILLNAMAENDTEILQAESNMEIRAKQRTKQRMRHRNKGRECHRNKSEAENTTYVHDQ